MADVFIQWEACLHGSAFFEYLVSNKPVVHLAVTSRYLPMGGSKAFNTESVKLAYGDDNEVLKSNRTAAVQTLSGTGACRLFADFQHRQAGTQRT